MNHTKVNYIYLIFRQHFQSTMSMSMSQYWSDLEQTEYDPEEFVERLAYRARTGGHQGLGEAEHLHEVFLAAIKDLKLMHEKQTTKCKVKYLFIKSLTK